MSETNAQMHKRLRAEAVARGLFYVCRCRFPKPGRRVCEDCKDRVDRWQSTTRKGIALRRRIGRKSTVKRLAAREAAGLCVQCGRAPAVAGYVRCSVHLDAQANRVRAAARAGGVQPDSRRCTVCGSPNHFANRHDRPGVPP